MTRTSAANAELPAGDVAVVDVYANRLIWWLAISLVALEILFVIADATINAGRMIDIGAIRRFFNIAREDGVASWFAVTQTWMAGMTAAAIWVVVRAQGATRLRRNGWLILTMFVLYMAVDDGAQVHERLGSTVKKLAENSNDGEGLAGIFPSYPWQLLFLPIFGSFGLFTLWFIDREANHHRTDRFLVVSFVGLLVCAVILDFFEGLDRDHPMNPTTTVQAALDWSKYQIRHFSKSLEEFLEMFAITLLWVLFLRRLSRLTPEIRIRFPAPRNPA